MSRSMPILLTIIPHCTEELGLLELETLAMLKLTVQ